MRPGYVGIAQMVHVPAGFLVSTLDSLLIKRGAHALTVRRAMTTVASCLEATCAVAYALASTPLRAAVAAVRACAEERGRLVETEASGGIALDNVRAYAECGVDRISIGSLTHSAPALDLSMVVEGVE